jgi:multiple sugar transport system substrate-binding protein
MSRTLLSRRRFLHLAGGLATSAPVLGAVIPEALASPSDSKITITFGEAEWGARLTNTIRTQIIPDFERLHPNIEVKTLFLTDNKAYTSQMVSRVAAGNPIEVASTWSSPVSLAARGLLEPLDQYMATSQHSRPQSWPVQELVDCVWSGRTYALPITASSYAFWYNVDWLEKKGVPVTREKFPKTWDDLRALSKEFTYWKGDHLESAGYVPMRFSQDINAIPPTMYIWSALNGGQLYDPVKKVYTIDSEQNIAMMEYMVAWLNEEYKGNMTAVEASGNWAIGADLQNRPGLFKPGRLAMGVTGSWALNVMNKKGGMTFDKYNVASFPVGPMGKRTWGGSWPIWLGIPKGARNKDAAFLWMDYLSSIGMVAWANTVPDLPANKTVPDIVPATVVQDQGEAFATDVIRFFRHQAEIAPPMWSSPVEDFCQTQFMSAVERIMYKQQKPKEGLVAAQQICQNRLKQALSAAKS